MKGAFSLGEQFSWGELPAQQEIAAGTDADALEADIEALLAEAHRGVGGKAVAPASEPTINLFNRVKPAMATVTGNFRLTATDAENDIRHMIFDFGDVTFPVLEGQSIGIVMPGTDANGEPHRIRLYAISSPRHGERPNTNKISLTVKRETQGVCSNYVCDLTKGDKVAVTGPFGATYLMPNDPASHTIMICTGTGSAPFRAFTEWRRRTMPRLRGGCCCSSVPAALRNCPISGRCRRCRKPRSPSTSPVRASPASPRPTFKISCASKVLAPLLAQDRTHIYVCGLKGMEQGVEAALDDICRSSELNWSQTRNAMRDQRRYHVETY